MDGIIDRQPEIISMLARVETKIEKSNKMLNSLIIMASGIILALDPEKGKEDGNAN